LSRVLSLCKKTGFFILFILFMLTVSVVSVYGADTKIKFVKEDTICQEILDLGLKAGTKNYGNNLLMNFDSSGNVLGFSHGIGLSIKVYPESDGALKYFNNIPIYKPPSRTFQVLENIRNDKKISWIEKSSNITGCSRCILFRDNIIIIIKGTSLNTGGFDVQKAADILEKHARTILSDKLQEYFFSGVVKGSTGQPLSHIELILMIEDQKYKTTTDASGYYSIDYKGSVKKGFDCRLYAVLQNKRNDKTYYRILWRDQPVWVMKSFKLKNTDDLMQDLDFREAEKEGPVYDGAPKLKLLPHFSAMYYHMAEALDFYMDYMKYNLDYKLPVDVVSGYKYGTLYDPFDSTIYIDYSDSSCRSPERPMNREWHEFSHHALFSMYGRWPSLPEGTVNHDGYINPSTGDSFNEGFAEFMAMMIADYYKYPNPHVYSHFGSLEANYKAWHYRGQAEEFAVAGVLWDLYDAVNDDEVQLTSNDIWYILKDYHPDFASVYNTLINKYPGKKAGIDEIFKSHGFFIDKTAGNGKWDTLEPFRDSNNNRRYDSGEYFVDYGLPAMTYTNGEILGPAGNYQRVDRKSAGMLPGQFIKVNNQVASYLVEVIIPDNPGLNYKLATENKNGIIYVQIPPPEYNAVITVTPEGVKAENILTFNSNDYNEKMSEAIERGYYAEHDFQISGEAASSGPELPPAEANDTDDTGKKPPRWDVISQAAAKPDDYKYNPAGLEFMPSNTKTGTSSHAPASSFGLIGLAALLVIAVIVIGIILIKKKK